MKKPKRKNVQDATLKNNRARSKEIAKLKQQLDALTLDVDGLMKRINRIEDNMKDLF